MNSMLARRITTVLTSAHHFEPEGFPSLLKGIRSDVRCRPEVEAP